MEEEKVVRAEAGESTLTGLCAGRGMGGGL